MTTERGELVGQEDQQRSAVSAVLQWWNWRIGLKLAAILVVPVIALGAVGCWLVASEVSHANDYARADDVVSVKITAQSLINRLQDERTASARFLAGSERFDPRALPEQWKQSDSARAATDHAVEAAQEPGVTARYGAVAQQIRTLAMTRESVRDRSADSDAVQRQYSGVINEMLRFDQVLVGGVGLSEVSGTATSLSQLASAGEQVAAEDAVVAAGLSRGSVTPGEGMALRVASARFDARMADFHATASPEDIARYNRMVSGPDVATRKALVRSVEDQAPTQSSSKASTLRLDAAEWNRATSNVSRMQRSAQQAGLAKLREASAGLQDRTSSLAGAEAVILVALLTVATFVLGVIGRHLIRSLETLRHNALDIANERLPNAVASVRDGGALERAVEPIPISTTEEVGQLARAVDALHSEAVRLASEQGELRNNLNATFVNVSRRSQNMVEHLLRELEHLESSEEDPDKLSSLFTLDHLATRMRRNNENLTVLSGSDLSRRFAQSLSLGDVLRAAVSEIDQYERVVIRASPSVHVAGYVAGDVIRLLAELLDNAGAYSSPDTQVTVSSEHHADNDLLVEVADQGIGMSEAKLTSANRKLAEGGVPDASVSRQMGLFVVGRLAQKHGIQVRLLGGTVGVRAAVTIPQDLLAPENQATVHSTPLATASNGNSVRDQLIPGPRTTQLLGGSEREADQTWASGELNVPGDNGAEQWPAELPEHAHGASTSGSREMPRLPEASSSANNLFTAVTPAAEPDFDGWPDFPPADLATGSSAHSGHNARGEPNALGEQSAPGVRDAPGRQKAPSGYSEPGGYRGRDDSASSAGPRPAAGWFADAPPVEEGPQGAGWPSGEPNRDATGDSSGTRKHQLDAASTSDWAAQAEGSQAASRVARSEPPAQTESGLPKRKPRANLVAGSANSDERPAPTAPPPDAEDLRHRLSRFQAGVTGKHSDSPQRPNGHADGPEGRFK